MDRQTHPSRDINMIYLNFCIFSISFIYIYSPPVEQNPYLFSWIKDRGTYPHQMQRMWSFSSPDHLGTKTKMATNRQLWDCENLGLKNIKRS